MALVPGNKAEPAGDPRRLGTGGTSSRALSRMILKRKAFDDLTLAVADGLFEMGQTIVSIASENAADSPYDPYPSGEGLPKQGGVLAYVGNQKVGGWSERGDQPKKPRAVRASTKEHSAVVVVGFGFPARFNELGTVKMIAQPFLSPARDAVAPRVAEYVTAKVRRVG